MDDWRDSPWFEPLSPVAPSTEPAVALPGGSDPLVGTVLPGRFPIDAAVAAGSFGAVYRARQLAVGRDIAVKVVRAGVDPFSEDGRLFVPEIRAVARIDHPHVVRVYQADVTADGRLFFAMEWLAGRDLQAILADGPIAPARAVALVKQLLGALEAAHQAGIVHADVKPGNAIVVGERLVLVDFGLARARERSGADGLAGPASVDPRGRALVVAVLAARVLSPPGAQRPLPELDPAIGDALGPRAAGAPPPPA